MSQPDKTSQYLPESDIAKLSDFQLSTPLAIRNMLGELAKSRGPISLYSDENPAVFVISRLEGVDEDSIALELRTDRARKADLLEHGRCTVVAFLDKIKVQFEAVFDAENIDPEALSVRCHLPETAFRIQRRSAYRVRPPVGQTGQLVVRGEPGQELEFELMDLSATGVSFYRSEADTPVALNERHEHARLEIGPRVPVPCTIEVRTIRKLERLPGKPQGWRIGCEFVDMPPEVQRLLQTYVQDVERLFIRMSREQAGRD